MEKQEMIKKLEEMEKIPYYNNSRFNLLKKLCLGLDDDDEDLTEIYLTPTIFEKIIELFIDCYNEIELLNWLSNNDYNPINNFRYAEIREYCEIDDDELTEVLDNCLFYDENNEIIVISW
jgi:hypothetical protein